MEKHKCLVCGDLVSIENMPHRTPGCKVLELQAEKLKDQPYNFTFGNSQSAMYMEDWLRANPQYYQVTQRNLSRFNLGIKTLLKVKDESIYHTLIILWRKNQVEHVKALKVPQTLKNFMLSLMATKYRNAYHEAGLPVGH